MRKPTKIRENHLKRHYNLSLDDYDRLLTKQKGLCAICEEPCKSGKRLAVDHNHSTGQVRGLLCLRCNTAMERIDIPGWLNKAMRYTDTKEDS